MKGKEIDWKDRVLQMTDGNNHHLQELGKRVNIEITDYDIGGEGYWCRGICVKVNGVDIGGNFNSGIEIMGGVLKHLGYEVDIESNYDI
jgi:hypothetical protein